MKKIFFSSTCLLLLFSAKLYSTNSPTASLSKAALASRYYSQKETMLQHPSPIKPAPEAPEVTGPPFSCDNLNKYDIGTPTTPSTGPKSPWTCSPSKRLPLKYISQ